MNNTKAALNPTISPSTDEAVVPAIVDAVADAEGVSPLELDPLAHAVDTDGLVAALESMDAWNEVSIGSVEFPYSGYLVTVTEDVDVSLAPLHELD